MRQGQTIKVAEFPVSDSATADALGKFAKRPFTYNDQTLWCRCRFEEGTGKIKGEPVLAKDPNDPPDVNSVRLTLGMCSSFAVWPRPLKVVPADDLMDVCQGDALRPQFVFLAINWSSQISPGSVVDGTASKYFGEIPRWVNFHSIRSSRTREGKEDRCRLAAAFEYDNPFRGGYMTDFVKGLVDSNAHSVFKFLRKGSLDGCDESPFIIFLDILKNELAALDEAFGLDKYGRDRKYLIVFGPTIYNGLQNLAHRILGKSLDELFPDRTVLRTGSFYAFPHGKTREQVIEGIRTLHFPDGAIRMVDAFKFDVVKCACPRRPGCDSGTSGAKA